ncbi:hypothetical protein [Modicisalibacter sp. 'Wilcox']|uniref:hypothetical protein n=1 Tax=Modicisalibacter sp. 'Wilcox' TaxID=2679914 RepID=UPI0013D75A9A|nr:hypothetical protein [Modicisalibacter sp. 'Wilcox']
MGWADSAADGATGGTGGYGGDAAGGGGYGNDNALGRAVNAAQEDNGGFGATRTHTHFSGSSVSNGYAQPGTVDSGRQAGGFMSRVDAGYRGRFGRELNAERSQANQGITSGSIADMADVADEAAKSFLDRTSFETYAGMPRSYNPSANLSRAESAVETIADRTGRQPGDVGNMIGREDFGRMANGNLSAAYGGVQRAAQPHGLLATAQDVALGFAGPLGVAADTAIDSVVGGRRAANTFSALNDQYDTSFDTGLADNIGTQAAANTMGTIASAGLSHFGANVGLGLAGVNGARVGGLLGNATGGQMGDMALNGGQARPPASTPVGNGNSQPRGLLATAVNQPAVATPSVSYSPISIDDYASYAENFFA